MATSLFRVKRYSHPKYKFVVRAKLGGKWRRRYFCTEDEAMAFAERQNGAIQTLNGENPSQMEALASVEALRGVHRTETVLSSADLSGLTYPVYSGPRIHRYIGDSWCMHLPFAYDLMREVAPKVFVELGVKEGESYFAFCQSAAENKIDVKCYGVDSWRGDVQTGSLDPKIQEEVVNYNWRYSSFSELKPMFFSEAVDQFADGCIDLLHIDGTHTYADVKADFESWLPKISDNGIVLFHDVMLRDRGFGVWKVWQDIARENNSFLFEFGFGLGVWKKTPVRPSDCGFIRNLISGNPAQRRRRNESYAQAAATLALWEIARRLGQGQSDQFSTTEPETRLAEISHFRREMDTQIEQSAQLQRALDEKTTNLEQKVQDLAQERQALEQARQDLAQERQALEQARQELAQERQALEQARQDLAQARQELEQERQGRNQARQDLEQARRDLELKSQEAERIHVLQRDLEVKIRQSSELATTCEQLANRLAELQREVQEKSARISHLEHVSDDKAQQIERLRKDIARQIEAAQRAGRETAETRWEMLSLRKGTLSRTDSLQAASARVGELENEVMALSNERQYSREAASRLLAELADNRSNVENLERQLQAVREELDRVQQGHEATEKRLAKYRKHLGRLDGLTARKLILPFGRRHRRLRETIDNAARI
jgi:chromosome segregation ATPase